MEPQLGRGCHTKRFSRRQALKQAAASTVLALTNQAPLRAEEESPTTDSNVELQIARISGFTFRLTLSPVENGRSIPQSRHPSIRYMLCRLSSIGRFPHHARQKCNRSAHFGAGHGRIPRRRQHNQACRSPSSTSARRDRAGPAPPAVGCRGLALGAGPSSSNSPRRPR